MTPLQYGILAVLLALGVGAVLRRDDLTEILRDFFSRPDHPLNLAVFRIVLVLTVLGTIDPSSVYDYSRMSADLLSPPLGTGWMIPWFPLDPTAVGYAVLLAYLFGVLSVIGLYTRFSLVLFTAASFYLLTIPQLFGKVNHYHHLLWFLVILCFSPCARVLSADALRDAWRSNPTDEPPVTASRRFGVPLRFCWILMGILYLFPGFWKLWLGGEAWIAGDQFRYVLYHKWFELGGWTPAFRIDRYPLLYRTGAAFAIVFEVGFIVALFRKTTRYLWAGMGLCFHQFTNYFMQIGFWNLQVLYVMFVDWHELCRRLGTSIWEQPLRIRVDPRFPRVAGTINALRRVDLLDQLSVSVEDIDSSGSSTVLTAEPAGRTRRNEAALYPLLRRLPLCWPALFLLWIPPIRRRLWQRLTARRDASRETASPASVGSARILHRSLLMVGTFLILSTGLFGAVGKGFAWPLAAYPSFAEPRGPTVWSIELEMTRNDEVLVVMDETEIRRALGVPSDRFRGLVRRLLDAEDFSDFRRRSRSVLDQLARREALPPGTEQIHVYSVERSVHPERLDDTPVRRNRVITLRRTSTSKPEPVEEP